MRGEPRNIRLSILPAYAHSRVTICLREAGRAPTRASVTPPSIAVGTEAILVRAAACRRDKGGIFRNSDGEAPDCKRQCDCDQHLGFALALDGYLLGAGRTHGIIPRWCDHHLG